MYDQMLKCSVLYYLLAMIFFCPCDAFISDIINTIRSPFSEVCDNRWVPQNILGLEEDLKYFVFGQHIAADTVLIALQSHLNKKHRLKPLVLSFHGWPGGGKGYVGKFILKNFFGEGEKSKFVRSYVSRIDFPLQSEVNNYQKQLQKDLEDTISRCPKAVFIFDEVDKYPSKVLDGIKAYLDFSSNVNGHDFREAIFIFITNNGQKEITDITVNNYKNGYEREQLEFKDFEYVLKTTAFNDDGGFYRSDLIKHHLIDYVVPFLPLERSHIEKCVVVEMMLQQFHHNNHDDVFNAIIEELPFGPPGYELFSTNGCKNIHEKVSYFKEKARRRSIHSEF